MKKQIVALTAIAALTAGAAGQVASASSSYTVEKGETLWGISQTTNVTVQDLTDWNDLSSTIIYPNQELKISNKEETYTVISGDTLESISHAHDISLDELMGNNGLSSDLIFPGDQLVINGETSPTAEQSSAPAEQSSPTAEQSSAPADSVEEAPAQDAGTTQSLEGVEGTGGEQPSSEATQELTVSATAYTASCAGCSGITATGIDLRDNPNQKVISVDPSVIPLGSRVWVEGYGEAIAGDTGGAIKGNKIDVFVPSQDAALSWGVKEVKVKILN